MKDFKPSKSVEIKRQPDDPEQSKCFLEAAKEHGADETEAAAKRAFKAVVKPRNPQK
jgi:hypothetical protein